MYIKGYKNVLIKATAVMISLLFAFNPVLPFMADLFINIASAEIVDFEGDDLTVYPISDNSIQKTINTIAASASDDSPGSGKIVFDNDYAENITIPDDTNIVIDLNGHTLSPINDSIYRSNVIVYGKLKLKNGLSEGGLESDGTLDIRAMDVVSGGIMIVENVVIDNYHASMNGAGVIAEKNSQVKLSNSEFRNCSSTLNGGGLYAYQADSIDIVNTAFSQCTSENGGGIYYYRTCNVGESADITYDGLTLNSNTATGNGGGIYVEYPLNLSLANSHIDSNTAGMGGGMYFKNTVDLTLSEGSSVSDNVAQTGAGGGIYFYAASTYTGSSLTLNDSQINNNTAADSGGGVFFRNEVVSNRHTIALNDSQLNGNISENRGGAFYAYAKTDIVLNNTEISGNSASTYGGGFYMEGGQTDSNRSTFTMDNSSVSENSLTADVLNRYGAGAFFGVRTIVTLNSGDFTHNTNARFGGGAYFDTNCEVSIHEGMTVSRNTVKIPQNNDWHRGIGFYLANCILTMTGGEFSENKDTEIYSSGGGLYVSGGTAIITGGRFINNETYHYGAAIDVQSATADISGDVYMSGNYAHNDGGAISAFYSTVDIGGNVTLENNRSAYGGAVYIERSMVDIRENVVMRGNSASSNGGAVYVYLDDRANEYFHLMGGSITENTAYNGGGLYFITRRSEKYKINLTGGSITNNTATNCGGGMLAARIGGEEYISSTQRPAYAAQAIELSTNITISGNTAGNNGGGVYVDAASRIELYDGAKIIQNSANNGGGIFVNDNGYYYRNFYNAKTGESGETEAVDIYGGELHDNFSRVRGHDVYVGESANTVYYKPSVIHAVAASSMENSDQGAYWLDENRLSHITGEASNLEKVTNGETPKYSCYTFVYSNDAVASVGATEYDSVQAAVDAIAASTASGSDILLLKDHRETVIVPNGVTASLDMNGFSIYGEGGTVITVEENASFNITDKKGTSVISQGRGTYFTENRFGMWVNYYYGGGILSQGEVCVDGVRIEGNSSYFGSAVFAYGGSLELKNVTIGSNIYVQNQNQDSSSICTKDADLTLTNVSFENASNRCLYINGTGNINITDTTVKNCTGYTLCFIYCNSGQAVVNINNCEYSNNTNTYSTDNYNSGYPIMQFNSTNVTIKDTIIRDNSCTYISGILVNQARVYLDNVLITGNKSKGNYGGVSVAGTNSKLYMKNSKIYGNTAAGVGSDIHLDKDCMFINDAPDGTGVTDHRTVESFGLPDYNSWVNESIGEYYVSDKAAHDSTVSQFKNVSGDLINSETDKVLSSVNLTAVKAMETSEDAVAEIKSNGRKFQSLSLAIANALTLGEDTEIRLLKDITERIGVPANRSLITIDFNGHTLTAPSEQVNSFSITAADIRLHDSVGGGKFKAEESDSPSVMRGIYLNGGSLTIEDIEISGFNSTLEGAGIYATAGSTVNSVFYPSKIYLKSGSVRNNHTTLRGGALYFKTDSANKENVFEMTGGSIYGNSADGDGGGMYFYCYNSQLRTSVHITGGTIENNTSKASGGGVFYNAYGYASDEADLHIYGCTFRDNTALNYGAVYFNQAGGKSNPIIVGSDDSSIKTVFDGNHSTNSYAAGYIGNTRASTETTLVRNVDVINQTSEGSGATLRFCSNRMSVKNVEVHDNSSNVSDSGLVIAAGELLIEDCNFYDNTSRGTFSGLCVSDPGAAIREGTKTVKNCKFHNNTASSGASLWDNNLGSVTYYNCELYDNNNTYKSSGGNYGGIAVFAGNTAKNKNIFNCHFHDNYSSSMGAAIGTNGLYDTTITIKDTMIENSEAYYNGGAISCSWGSSNNTFVLDSGTTVRNNKAGSEGGAVYIYDQTLIIKDGCTISGNSSVSRGGAISWQGYSSTHYLTMSGGTIENNTAGGAGGAVYAYGRSALNSDRLPITFSGGTITNNTSQSDGGGIYLTGTASWDYYNYEPPAIRFTGTVITENYAKSNGGGIFNSTDCRDTVINPETVITENTSGGSGGGLYVGAQRTNVDVNNGTKLYGNRSMIGNDIYVSHSNSYRSSYLNLERAGAMFSSEDDYIGVSWLDETNGATTTDSINIRPLTRGYPYTIIYQPKNKVVAVYNGVEYGLVQDAVDAVTASGRAGEVIMVDDSAESITIDGKANVTLNLNGHTLQGTGMSAITNRGVLEIVDNKKSVTVGSNTYDSQATDGTITGNSNTIGGGVQVISGTVKMRSGVITGCFAGRDSTDSAYGGGAVGISGGEFALYGGTITDNVAVVGSAVLITKPSGIFTMYGGSITNNTGSKRFDPITNNTYGTIYNVSGQVNIYGGTISGNVSRFGGGIYSNSGTVNIAGASNENGPVIENNTGGYSGGGLYLGSGEMIISNATVRNNKTTYEKHNSVNRDSYLNQGAGGGIYVSNGALTLLDGTKITGNTAIRGGGIYQYRGTVQIGGEGTVITENRAELGGGCAQNPLPGISTVIMTLIDGASVYGNRSTSSGSGNDFYSAYEGTNTYDQQVGNVLYKPSLTMTAASRTGVGSTYNVWKNDAYTGSNRVGEDYISGQYIFDEVTLCNDVQITAAHYNIENNTSLDSNFKITHLNVKKMVDGNDNYDDGLTHSGQMLSSSLEYEKTAKSLLNESGSGAVEVDETYVFNEQTYKYIKYNGKLYEQNEAVEWQPGNDSGDGNKIIRSFDKITYEFDYTFESVPKQEEYTRNYNCELMFKVILPCDRSEATIEPNNNMSSVSIITSTDANGKTIQTMTGYIKKIFTPKDVATGAQTENVVLRIKGMENGSKIKPSFEMWFNGNTVSPHGSCVAEQVTVSAAPKYNVSVLNNPRLHHTGYFDVVNKVEVGESEKDSPDVVYGTVMGFGVTVELHNDPTVKGLLGIELPENKLEFDLNCEGKLYSQGRNIVPNGTKAPILWAYKENNSSNYGRDLTSNIDIVNMSWDDEDFKDKCSHFAYAAAPYNSGANAQSCYDGGGWTITQAAASGSTETKFHVKVNNYRIDDTNYPTQYSGSVSSSHLNSSAVKAFTAGYMQLILPLEPPKDMNAYGYFQVYMDVAASALDVKSVTGQIPDNVQTSSTLDTEEKIKKDLDSMNEYFGLPDSNELKTLGLAKNERRYYDNYANVNQALTVYPEGEKGTVVGKAAIFNKADNTHINGVGVDDTGRGDTPLSSTIYIEGDLTFSSEMINTGDENDPAHFGKNDPRYNAAVFNVLEYNYMTAYNILQKFDANVFTVTGAPAVVNVQNGAALDNLLGDNFKITTTETELTWATNLSTKYKLTILYGAKPDGSNWDKIKKVDRTVEPNINYDDGGSADMDRYREENLKFYKTLDDLHRSLGTDAKCVAILYQFRDTVIRTENSISACAKATVTSDFERVGQTYCTTNDVRAWYSYRPHYKLDYYENLNYAKQYSFNWVEMQHNTDEQTTDPSKDDYKPPVYGSVLPPGVFMNIPDDSETNTMTVDERAQAAAVYSVYTQSGSEYGPHPIQCEEYSNGYIKSEYRNGVKVGGTHNGMNIGNSVLLYSVDTSIKLNVETKIAHSNRTKENYNITLGERDVKYRVSPTVTVASSANRTELVRNGTQSADIEVKIEIPKDLHFIDGSVTFDYTHSGYTEGSMNWEIERETDKDGVTWIYLKTHVSDIDIALPEAMFDCFIGDAQVPANDIKQTGTALTVNAYISAEYASANLLAAETRSASSTINVLLTSSEGIVESVDKTLVELGEEFTYSLTYSNTIDGPSYRIQLADVLSHNNDGRGTNYTGGYRITSMSIAFTNHDDYEAFLNDADRGNLQITTGKYTWNNSNSENINALNDLMDSIESGSKQVIANDKVTFDSVANKITYDLSDQVIFAPAYSAAQNTVKEAPAILAYLPQVSGNNRVCITATAATAEKNGDRIALITSGDNETLIKTQTGGNTYINNFVYRRITGTDDTGANVYSLPLVSNTVSTSAIKRNISGVVWMDQDHNGMYNTQEAVTYNNSHPEAKPIVLEYPISGITATLKKIDGSTNSTAKDVFGNDVEPVKTDDEGKYSFENIPSGNYTVVFTNDDDDYEFLSELSNDNHHPLPFEKLSVTQNVQSDRGNKSKSSYSSSDSLDECSLINNVIMPAKENIPTMNYYSTNWNLGLYYTDLTVSKTWTNMVYGIADGTVMDVSVKGTQSGSDTVVYEGMLRITSTNEVPSAIYFENGDLNTAIPKQIEVTKSADGKTVKWETSQNDRLYLQAENETGVIDYLIKEITISLDGRDVQGFYNVVEQDVVDPITNKTTHTVLNSQILGSVTIVKKSSVGDPLEGAQFSIYQVDSEKPSSDDSYYGAHEGVGTTLTESYQTKVSSMYSKVILGKDTNIEILKSLGMYDAKSKTLTFTSGGSTYSFIVHIEADGPEKKYYYYTDNNVTFNYEMIIGNADEHNRWLSEGLLDVNDIYYQDGVAYNVSSRWVTEGSQYVKQYYITITVNPRNYDKVAILEFSDLPLYDTQGNFIYYTVRETKEPDGFISIADFNTLTGMNLNTGFKNSDDEYVHNLGFEVENVRAMELPTTGGSEMRLIIVIGTMLVMLGSTAVFLMIKRRRAEVNLRE